MSNPVVTPVLSTALRSRSRALSNELSQAQVAASNRYKHISGLREEQTYLSIHFPMSSRRVALENEILQHSMKYSSILLKIDFIQRQLHEVRSQLNGSNGEATNTDDVEMEISATGYGYMQAGALCRHHVHGWVFVLETGMLKHRVFVLGSKRGFSRQAAQVYRFLAFRHAITQAFLPPEVAEQVQEPTVPMEAQSVAPQFSTRPTVYPYDFLWNELPLLQDIDGEEGPGAHIPPVLFEWIEEDLPPLVEQGLPPLVEVFEPEAEQAGHHVVFPGVNGPELVFFPDEPEEINYPLSDDEEDVVVQQDMAAYDAQLPPAHAMTIAQWIQALPALFGLNQPQSAVISSHGSHTYTVDNQIPSRREEVVHAPPQLIRTTIRNHPAICANTKKVKSAAEREFQKNRTRARDIDRAEKAFQSVIYAVDPDANQPQIGFNMGELLSSLGAKAGDFVANCEKVSSTLTSAAKGLETITASVQAVVPWLKIFLKASVLMLCMGLCIYAITHSHPAIGAVAGALLICLSGITGFVVTNDILSLFLRDYNKYFKPDGMQAQIGAAIPLEGGYISKLFVAVFSMGFAAFGDRKKGVFNLLKDFVVSFPSVVKGIDGIIDFTSKITLTMLNAIRSKLGVDVYSSLCEHRDPFMNWVTEVEAYLDRIGRGEVQPSAFMLGQLNVYIEQGRGHNQFLRQITDDLGARSRMGTLMSALAKARDSCVAFNPNIASSRPAPICIYVSGTPGRGKSTFCKLLARAWLARKLDPEALTLAERHLSAFLYHRTPETEYWDGYGRQPVCIFDDFLQKKEIAGGESAALDMIRCVNGEVALLHMANLNDKGSTYFTSDLVILSSNVKRPASEAVVSIDAVMRRPDIYIELDFQDDFMENANVLGGKIIKHDKLAAFNAMKTFEEKTLVYKLTRYYIDQNRNPQDMNEVSASWILDTILEKGITNACVFDNKLPPSMAGVMPDVEEIKKKLQARLHSQTITDVRFKFTDHPHGGKDKYALFQAKMDAYLRARLMEGPGSDAAQNLQVELIFLLEPCGMTFNYILSEYSAIISECDYMRNKRERADSNAELQEVYTTTTRETISPMCYFASLFTNVGNKITKVCGELWSLFTTYWPWILAAAAALGVGLGLYKAFSMWSELSSNEPESFPVKMKSRIAAKGFKAFRGQRVARPAAAPLSSQGFEDKKSQLKKLLTSSYHIFWSKEDDRAFGHVQMISGRVGLVNLHICDVIRTKAELDKLTHVYLRRFGKKSVLIEVPIQRFTTINRDEDAMHLDLAMVYLVDCGMPESHDFIDNIPYMEAYEHRSQLSVLLPHPAADDEHPTFVEDPKAILHADTGPYPNPLSKIDPLAEEYTNMMNITYIASTRSGHCGLPVVSDTLGQGEYFVGIHKCGNNSSGGAAPLFREWIDRELLALKKLYPYLEVRKHKDLAEFQPTKNFVSQCYPALTLGTVPSFHGSEQTKLRPLPHAHMFEMHSAPAIMKVSRVDGKVVSPYYLNRLKLPDLLKSFPSMPKLRPFVSAVINDTRQSEAADLKYWRRRMTVAEAMDGIQGTVFASIDLATSMGYPWVLSGQPTKGPWFRDPVLRARLVKEVEVKLALLKRGFRPVFLHMDVLKDERRTLEKVATCATRVVVVGPVDLLILNRMFFGGFASWIQINRIENGITIGMNPYANEMNDLCRKLFLPLYKIYAGDSKGFDLKQHSELLRAIFSAINDWYDDPEDNAIRDILSLEFMFPRHLTFPTHIGEELRAELRKVPDSDNPNEVPMHVRILNAALHSGLAFVYEVWSGHPSGSYLTALINSLYSKVKPLLLLLKECGYDAALAHYRDRRVITMTLGDDFITAVHPSLVHILNAKKFAEFSASYGMEVTRENKEPITTEFPDDPPVFLKRLLHYSEYHGRYVGALDKEAIIDAMCWVRKSDSSQSELEQQFLGALAEFSLWGPVEYEKWRRPIQQAARHTLRNSFVAPDWATSGHHLHSLGDYRP